jgi:hypothetical protein
VAFESYEAATGAARRDAEIVVELSQENALTLFTAWGAVQSAWASARLDGCETGVIELRQALAACADQGNKLWAPFCQGLLAEIEAQGDAAAALIRIGELPQCSKVQILIFNDILTPDSCPGRSSGRYAMFTPRSCHRRLSVQF